MSYESNRARVNVTVLPPRSEPAPMVYPNNADTCTVLPTPTRSGLDYRTCVAQAQDGPAPTLVVDLHERLRAGSREEAVVELMRCRADAMARDPRLGGKTIGVKGVAGTELDLIFLQGLGAVVDPLSEVCLNSAAAAVEVACAEWELLPPGRVTVHMGDFVVELEPVA